MGNKKPRMKSKAFTFRFTPEFAEALRNAAALDHRSVTAYVEHVIRQDRSRLIPGVYVTDGAFSFTSSGFEQSEGLTRRVVVSDVLQEQEVPDDRS